MTPRSRHPPQVLLFTQGLFVSACIMNVFGQDTVCSTNYMTVDGMINNDFSAMMCTCYDLN